MDYSGRGDRELGFFRLGIFEFFYRLGLVRGLKVRIVVWREFDLGNEDERYLIRICFRLSLGF